MVSYESMLHLVRKWGDVSSNGILNPSCECFASPHIEGLVGYRTVLGHAIVYGDPVCAPSDKPKLALAFEEYCKQNKWKSVYAIASEEFTNWAIPNLSAAAVEFGRKFLLNPSENPFNKTGPHATLVRRKVKRAQKVGTEVKEYLTHDPQLEAEIELLVKNWVSKRKGPQIHLCPVAIFDHRQGKRWFYASHQGKPVGILLLNEIQSSKGWLLNNVILSQEAPHGTSELLIISVLQALEKEGCMTVLAGPVPAHKLGKIHGLNRFSSKAVQCTYSLARRFFRLEGHEMFWRKFQPKECGSYLLFPQRNLSLGSMLAVLRAFNAHL